MGPSDPFSTLPRSGTPEAPPLPSGTISRPAGADPSDLGDGATTAGRPGHVPAPMAFGSRRLSSPLVGALAGLVFGLATVIWGVGPALVVVLFAGLGAALGVLVRAVSSGGLDLAAAWRALRRR